MFKVILAAGGGASTASQLKVEAVNLPNKMRS